MDGLHPWNLGRVLKRPKTFVDQKIRSYEEIQKGYPYINLTLVPLSILTLYDRLIQIPHKLPLQGKNVFIYGRTNLVCKPFANMCIARDASVSIAHSRSKNWQYLCQNADVVVSAMGRNERCITAEHIKEGWIFCFCVCICFCLYVGLISVLKKKHIFFCFFFAVFRNFFFVCAKTRQSI